ncbi:hypothetical protein SVAN01_10298 [Stagonosporopsis vannaccii]|nr:hypothetical protein SVAN01_10298 [Stagonosporopsis vannaccii]
MWSIVARARPRQTSVSRQYRGAISHVTSPPLLHGAQPPISSPAPTQAFKSRHSTTLRPECWHCFPTRPGSFSSAHPPHPEHDRARPVILDWGFQNGTNGFECVRQFSSLLNLGLRVCLGPRWRGVGNGLDWAGLDSGGELKTEGLIAARLETRQKRPRLSCRFSEAPARRIQAARRYWKSTSDFQRTPDSAATLSVFDITCTLNKFTHTRGFGLPSPGARLLRDKCSCFSPHTGEALCGVHMGVVSFPPRTSSVSSSKEASDRASRCISGIPQVDPP